MLRGFLILSLACSAVVARAAEDPGPLAFKSARLADYRGRFTALDDPKVTAAFDAPQLAPDDEVLGVTINGESRVYPARQIAWHHIVNDTLGGQPVVVTYCSICSSGVSFDPVIDGKRHRFEVYGLYEGVMVMCDRETESIWTHLGGECVVGSLKGRRLTSYPSLNTTWANWKKLHPATTVLDWNTPYRDHYAAALRSGESHIPPPFRTTMSPPDARLPENTLLIAVLADGQPHAYPYSALREAGGVAEETVGSVPIAVLFDPESRTGAAFDRRIEGQTLSFQADSASGPARFRDKETGSVWTIEGECAAGTLAGRHLKRLYSLQAEWYGWSAYYPQTTVFEVKPGDVRAPVP